MYFFMRFLCRFYLTNTAVRDLLIVDFAEPVIGCARAGVRENQPADGVCDSLVLHDAPVGDIQITVHELFVVGNRRAHFPRLLTVPAAENAGFFYRRISRPPEHRLNAVP